MTISHQFVSVVAFLLVGAAAPYSNSSESSRKPFSRLSSIRLTHDCNIRGEDANVEESFSTENELWDESFAKAQWMMPSIVERILLQPDTCTVATTTKPTTEPLELLSALDMSTADRTAAQEALLTREKVLVNVPSILSKAQCARLRNFLRNKMMKDDGGVDNVDGCPDHQVNIHENKLKKLIGPAAMERTYSLPAQQLGNAGDLSRAGVFLRRYQADGRPWMPFHADDNAFTVNIALTDDQDFIGGRLLALHQQGLRIVQRAEGDATCHAGSVYHAVSAMRAGTRYSLIIFLHR